MNLLVFSWVHETECAAGFVGRRHRLAFNGGDFRPFCSSWPDLLILARLRSWLPRLHWFLTLHLNFSLACGCLQPPHTLRGGLLHHEYKLWYLQKIWHQYQVVENSSKRRILQILMRDGFFPIDLRLCNKSFDLPFMNAGVEKSHGLTQAPDIPHHHCVCRKRQRVLCRHPTGISRGIHRLQFVSSRCPPVVSNSAAPDRSANQAWSLPPAGIASAAACPILSARICEDGVIA